VDVIERDPTFRKSQSKVLEKFRTFQKRLRMTWECENKTPVSARDATSAGTAQGLAVTHEALALLRDEGH
jgi:hypothetical protein